MGKYHQKNHLEFSKTQTVASPKTTKTTRWVGPLSWLWHIQKSYSNISKSKKTALKKKHTKISKIEKNKISSKRIKTKDIKKNIINTFKQLHLRLGQTRKDRIDVRYMTGGLVDHLREKCQTKWVGALLENRKYLLYMKIIYIYIIISNIIYKRHQKTI